MEAASSPREALKMNIDVRPTNGVLAEGARPVLRHRVAVALVAAPLAAVSFVCYGATGKGAIAAFMAVVLVTLSATDLERRIIPNRVVLPATVVVLIGSLAVAPTHTQNHVLAALAAGLAFVIPSLISRSAVGMGDAKLAAFLGAGLGWGAFGAIALAFFSVFPFALAALVRGGLSARKSTLPFGPFLAFGALVIVIVPRLVGVGG
jgi:leader peptidase (prepilin peptidase)/N-methyltransferase